ncbi:hypothetical protein [Williamsia sp.]|uniref:hypothetical protein n=1 Tax=Williamsia sp. TaxID=1872085 RepID=UPI002F95EA47
MLIAGPPTDRLRLPHQAWDPLMLVLRYTLWIGMFACVAALVTSGALYAYQRSSGAQILANTTLFRILCCSALVGSATLLANVLIA